MYFGNTTTGFPLCISYKCIFVDKNRYNSKIDDQTTQIFVKKYFELSSGI